MVWNPGQQLFGGRYIIVGKIGEGGIGMTYLARNEQKELRVIKTLREELLNKAAWRPHQAKLKQDFRDEAIRLAVCRHPYIVQIENIFDEDNLPCIVMEYIEGEDLSSRVRRLGVLSETEALLYIRQVGDALKVIHSKGLLHRDIKPRNIMIRADRNEAVLIDFGIAREFIPNAVQRHTVYRTPGFAPPEQYELEAPRGEYIDVYALAATLYNILTGILPRNAVDISPENPLESPQQYNPNISNRVNEAILRGMDLQPHHRPQSVQQWLDLLFGEEVELSHTPLFVPSPKTSQSFIGKKFVAPKPTSPSSETSLQWQCIRTISGHASMVHAVATSPDGQAMASGSNDNTVKLWQLSNGKHIRTFGRWFSGHSNMVNAVAFSPDGQLLASASSDETIKLWQISTGKEICTFKGHFNWVNTVTFSPLSSYQPGAGQIFASGGADGTIKLWLTTTVLEIGTFTGHTDSVCSIAFSPDGQLLASGSADCSLKLWEVITGRELHTFTGHSFFVNSVAISPNGQILASGSADNTIKLWNINTKQEILTMEGHSDSVWSVAFSPNGQLLASGSWDRTIKIWQVSTGTEMMTLAEHTSYVRSIAFSPNGKMIVTGSDDDTIKIWRQP
jgi:WD40 repeat protein/tRNA A-37 threonylcarbamoyl transferase component Bud32